VCSIVVVSEEFVLKRCVGHRFAFALIVLLCAPLVAMPTVHSVEAAKKLEQPSRQGGIGNTRGDAVAAYGKLPALHDFVVATSDRSVHYIFAHDETVMYPSGTETQVSLDVRVPSDKTTETDRVFDIEISAIYGDGGELVKTWTLADATELARKLLPRDAMPTETMALDANGGLLQSFHSKSIARLMPSEGACNGDVPGSVWVRLTPDGADTTTIVDVQVALDDPNLAPC